MKPGIYPRGELDYAAIPAINQSTLKRIAKSPLHMRHAVLNPIRSTGSMRLGTVAHTAVLELDRLDGEYAVYGAGIEVVLPDGTLATSKTAVMNGKVWEAFEALHTAAGRTIIKQPELEAALAVRKAVHSHKLATRYLDVGRAEQILVWRDEKTGLLCKARLDWLSDSVRDLMVELKTSPDISRRVFSSQFAKMQYDVQTAFYTMGYEAITGRTLYSKCIAVENTAPYDVIVYNLSEVVDRGKEIAREYLDAYAKCRNAGVWPGQSPDEEVVLQLPFWRRGEDEDDEDNFFRTLTEDGEGANV